MNSGTLHQTQQFDLSDVTLRRIFALLVILSLHILVLYTVFLADGFHAVRQNSSALFLSLIPAKSKPKTDVSVKEKPQERTASTKQTMAQNTVKPSQPQSSEPNIPQNDKPKSENTIDPALDPFAITQPRNDATPNTSRGERYRQEVGKAWKQVESELPVKRWLSTKKDLSKIEKFAQDVLAAAPAKDVQTKEEMLPDGSRMTRVKTPRGEFCVVAPQPGRTYDVRGPERRVMSCPIYF
ncbi:hypothetical protein H8K35_01055 [Undibacterium sp. LX40W]|uniref:Uncharacterized protein n=1 Tax=Undibacterium nitidum TaxID=2762298 RepID=A0A923HNG5_9BURK|nr:MULTISPECIES: hypothetical protein [Undibacterium]MBC3881031.1 hypothetical protein [Undibacterium nitidum]MBC3890236.1 hypothetical protein [Undibacterium sp. LX40W]